RGRRGSGPAGGPRPPPPAPAGAPTAPGRPPAPPGPRPAGAGSRPNAATHTLPSPSTAMPPVDCGQTNPSPGPPQYDITRPAESNSMTAGAGTQQTNEVGGLRIIAFSADSSESAPRCTIQTWS